MALSNHSAQFKCDSWNTMDVITDNFPIPREGILETDFLKNSASTDIPYDAQGFLKWHSIRIPCTRQDTVFILFRKIKIFYIKIKRSRNKDRISTVLALWRRSIREKCTSEESRCKRIY